MEKLNTLHFKGFNDKQKQLCCSIINRYGSGQHSIADDNTIDDFAISYLKDILESKEFIAAKSNLNALGKKTLKEIQAKL